MWVLTLYRNKSEANAVSAMSSIADAFGDNLRPETTTPMIAKVRRQKVVRIRQQLTHGTYDLDERLDAVLERILMDITL